MDRSGQKEYPEKKLSRPLTPEQTRSKHSKKSAMIKGKKKEMRL